MPIATSDSDNDVACFTSLRWRLVQRRPSESSVRTRNYMPGLGDVGNLVIDTITIIKILDHGHR
jgi:hypothetical protein